MGKKVKFTKAAAAADDAEKGDIKTDTSPKKQKDAKNASVKISDLPKVPFKAGTNRDTSEVDAEDVNVTLRTPARQLSEQDLSALGVTSEPGSTTGTTASGETSRRGEFGKNFKKPKEKTKITINDKVFIPKKGFYPKTSYRSPKMRPLISVTMLYTTESKSQIRQNNTDKSRNDNARTHCLKKGSVI